MNENNIFEIRRDRQKDKRDILILFIVLTVITLPLIAIPSVTIGVVLLFCGAYAVACGFTLLISRARENALITFDANGIKVDKRETCWENTKCCYFDVLGKNSRTLIFERKDGKKDYYPMGWLRYDKYEIAKYVNMLAGREVFDCDTSAKNIGSHLAYGYSLLFAFLCGIIPPIFDAIMDKPHKANAITSILIWLVVWVIAYFMCKKPIVEYVESKFEKAIGKEVF